MAEGAVVYLENRFEVIYCCNCQMPFAVPAATRARWRETGGDFYCPAGHSQHYTETEVQRLEKKLERERRSREFYQNRLTDERAAHEQTENRLRATKGVVTRTRKRVAAGTCPCCKRTFQQLARHMATKHPGYADNSAT